MSTVLETQAAKAELPEGWHWATVGDVTSTCRRGLAPVYEDGQTVVINQKCVRPGAQIDLAHAKLTNENAKPLPDWAVLQRGDILVNSTGTGTLGRVAWLRSSPEERMTADTHVAVVRPDDALISPEFLGWYLHGLQPAFESIATGSTNQKELRPADLAGMPVPVPPRDQQDCLVEVIERLMGDIDAGAARFSEGISGTAAFEAALYAEALCGSLAPFDADEEPAAALLEAVSADEVDAPRGRAWPQHWGATTLGQLASKVTSGSRDWKPYYNRGNGIFVLTQNVRMRRLDFTEVLRVDPPLSDPARARSAIAKDDLLLTIVGANVGNVARVPVQPHDHFACQSLGLIRLKEPRMSSFMELYMSSPHGGQRYFEGCFYGQGRPHISFDDIKRMPVPVPPLREQERIVEAFHRYFGEARRTANLLVAQLDDAESLKRSVMHSAFAGALAPSDRYGARQAEHNNDRAVLVAE